MTCRKMYSVIDAGGNYRQIHSQADPDSGTWVAWICAGAPVKTVSGALAVPVRYTGEGATSTNASNNCLAELNRRITQ